MQVPTPKIQGQTPEIQVQRPKKQVQRPKKQVQNLYIYIYVRYFTTNLIFSQMFLLVGKMFPHPVGVFCIHLEPPKSHIRKQKWVPKNFCVRGTWEALDGCKILLLGVGTFCPLVQTFFVFNVSFVKYLIYRLYILIYCILGVWICILDAWTCVWMPGLVFGCPDLYFGCLDLMKGHYQAWKMPD